MAELMLAQGHPAEALRIYRQVVGANPDDQAAKRRLAVLESELGRAGGKMSFRDHIQQIVDNVPGALACSVMGFDGIAIDSVERDGAGVDIPILLTEYAAAVTQLKQGAATQPEAGPVDELMVAGPQLIAILRLLTEEYFLAVVLHANGLVGKARYLMRVHTPDLLKELG